ncbi:sulfite exporter TauE/SafE family protein [Luedemannella helvata]|uniref:sulfite exporter TauE/SafE family protein n=1 Tax=Luedemannella helvata TaxID=349315 RepID=UPI0031D23F76
MDLLMTLAGFGVGAVVGLTGMGGGALMTPLLVLAFGVPPLAAVSSDLVASAVMKPFGGWVHARRGTVNWELVRWLCVGSVPAAFAGVLLTRLLPGDESVQHAIQYALGAALVLAAVGLIAKARAAQRAPAGATAQPIVVRPLPTALLGAGGGVIVGLTSVGSGSLIIVILLALYPALRPNDLVGTDLVQAVPLVGAAALGHALFGDLHLDIAGAILLGSVPGVLLGARFSSRAPAGVVRAALVVVLLTSALKMFGAPNALVLVVAAAAITIAIVVGVRARASSTTAAPVEPPILAKTGAE